MDVHKGLVEAQFEALRSLIEHPGDLGARSALDTLAPRDRHQLQAMKPGFSPAKATVVRDGEV